MPSVQSRMRAHRHAALCPIPLHLIIFLMYYILCVTFIMLTFFVFRPHLVPLMPLDWPIFSKYDTTWIQVIWLRFDIVIEFQSFPYSRNTNYIAGMGKLILIL
jgi:hypothetical protein